MRRSISTELAAVAVLLTAGLGVTTAAADAEGDFQELFGPAWQEARATPAAEDDLALARRMAAMAGDLTDRPDLRALLLQRTYDLVIHHDASFELAIDAAKRLAANTDRPRDDTEEMRLRAWRMHYQRATVAERSQRGEALIDAAVDIADARTEREQWDAAVDALREARDVATAIRSDRRAELGERLAALGHRRGIERQRQALLNRYEMLPDNAVLARRLMELHLIDLDDPATAEDYAEDPEASRMLRLATRPTANLDASQALALADWYAGLARKAEVPARPAMQRRQVAYLRRFIAASDDPVATAKAEQRLAELDQTGNPGAGRPTATADANQPAPADEQPEATDLLAKTDPETDDEYGLWQKSDKGLLHVVENGYGLIAFPAEVEGEYELEVEFTPAATRRLDGRFYLHLPISSAEQTYVRLATGHDNPYLGVQHQPRWGKARLAPGRAHRVTARITRHGLDVRIDVAVNGRGVGRWEGREGRFDDPDGYDYDEPGPANTLQPGVGFDNMRAVITRATVKPLNEGKVKELR